MHITKSMITRIMNGLIKRLKEAKTLADADPILKQLRANPTQIKLVEASILQRMNPNPASYEYGVSMLNTVIRELDPEEETASPESPGLKRKGDHFVKEEELSNHNPGDHGAGSEQSSENTEPYSGEGKKEGDEDMLNAPDTENQMKEEEEAPFPKNLSEMGGLHPDIAKGMGMKMPQMPPMGAGDQIKQTRYTIKQYHETVVKPLLAHSKKQDAAIKKLSQKIRETEARSGTYTMDMDTMKENAPARFRETTTANPMVETPKTTQELISMIQQGRNSKANLSEARSRITQMNNNM